MFALLRNSKQPRDVLEFSFRNEEANQLGWENENEFSYRNEMYDVIDKKAEGGILVIRCIADHHESELVKEYQKSNRQNQSHESVVQLITASFILPRTVSIHQSEREIKNHYPSYSTSLQQISSFVLAPPPEVC